MRVFGKIVLICLCCAGGYEAGAQKILKVRNIEARWEVSEDITPKQAEERAFLEAKKEALRKAGVMENVWSVFGQITQENGEEFLEAYSQMSVLAIGGMVNVTRKEVDVSWDPVAKRMSKVVTIDASVKKENLEDRSYVLEVKGIEPIYREGELFTCKIKIYGTDSYLKFFWFDASGGALLYPNTYEKDHLFKAGHVYSFPLSPEIDYYMEKKDKKASAEKVNIMVVATKSNIPFIEEINYPNLLKWIYQIPADQRCTFYQMAIVK